MCQPMHFPNDFILESGMWIPRDRNDTIGYTDGTESEQYLEKVLRSAKDLSSDSRELMDSICDWPSQYHLSPVRSNLLRCLSLAPSARVLEIGAGCGAITRYLGERVREVVAIEGSPSRARLCQLRCRDLSSVKVIAGDIFKMHLEETFDVVTLIGVLEYAGAFGGSAADPYQQMLRIARQFLRPGGQLVLAIENKFGIKYFAGCGEDHGAPLFAGMEGYPSGEGIQTFGRLELKRRLTEAGLEPSVLLLPFPDYKLPNNFLNAAHASAEEVMELGLGDWCRQANRDYLNPRQYLFDDHLALIELGRNGLLPDFANSFLWICDKEGGTRGVAIRPIEWVAQRYNVTRARVYQTKTTLALRDDQPTVTKELLWEPGSQQGREHSTRVKFSLQTDAFVPNAQSLALSMVRALRRKEGAEEAFTSLLREWESFLLREGAAPGESGTLRGEFLDCIPDNLLKGPDATWHFIDREWVWQDAVPMDWVLYRGLNSLWHHHSLAIDPAQSGTERGLEWFLYRCFDLMQRPMSLDAFERLRLGERSFQDFVERETESIPAVPTASVGMSRPSGWTIPGRIEWRGRDREGVENGLPAQSSIAQLFVDCGRGFQEEDSIVLPIRGNEQELSFDLTPYPEIRGLRFDPINHRAVVRIQQLLLYAADDSLRGLSSGIRYETTGEVLCTGEILFDTPDPQIYLLGLDEISSPTRLMVFLKVLASGPEVYAYLAHLKAQELARARELVAEQGARISRVSEEIGQLRLSLEQTQAQLGGLGSQNQELQSDLDRAREQIRDLEQALSRSLEGLGEKESLKRSLELELARIRSSTGYRIVQRLRRSDALFKPYMKLIKPVTKLVRNLV